MFTLCWFSTPGCNPSFRYTKHVGCRPNKRCNRTFAFDIYGDNALETAKKFERLVHDILKDFGCANKEKRAQILAEHKVKAKRTIADTSDTLEWHLFQGASKAFEEKLKGSASSATCFYVQFNSICFWVTYVHTYIYKAFLCLDFAFPSTSSVPNTFSVRVSIQSRMYILYTYMIVGVSFGFPKRTTYVQSQFAKK